MVVRHVVRAVHGQSERLVMVGLLLFRTWRRRTLKAPRHFGRRGCAGGKGLLHSPRAHPAFHIFFQSPLAHTRTYANTLLPRPNMCFLFQNAARWIHCNDVVGPRRSRPSGCVSVMARRSSTTSAGMPTYGSTSSSSLSGDHGGKLGGSVRKV